MNLHKKRGSPKTSPMNKADWAGRNPTVDPGSSLLM